MVDGERMLFGFHGIWQGVAVLYDRKTKSQWLHLTGECIRGSMKGRRLEPVSGRHMTWRQWRTEHPDTEVMAADPDFRRFYFSAKSANRGGDFFPPFFEGTIQDRDKRLGLSDLLYGVTDGGAAKAFPYREFASATQSLVLNDQVGEMPIVVVYSPESKTCSAFIRKLDGEEVQFERSEVGMRVRGGQDLFDFSGACTDGSRMGQRLTAVGLQAEWYGWFATHPMTEVWRRDAENSDGGDANVPTPPPSGSDSVERAARGGDGE